VYPVLISGAGTSRARCDARVLDMQQSADSWVRLLMVQTFIYSSGHGGRVDYDEGGQRQDVVKKAPQHSSPASETALLTFCTGHWATSTRCIDAAKLCWQHRCQNMEAGRWPKEAAILIRG
jgi:hypothetical protein